MQKIVINLTLRDQRDHLQAPHRLPDCTPKGRGLIKTHLSRESLSEFQRFMEKRIL